MGTLYIVSTPIGNLEDITVRAIKTLGSVKYIASEDTRRTGQLLAHLKQHYTSIYRYIAVNSQKLIAYYDQTEPQKAPEIIALLEQGEDVALVSDAGTPLVNDPGFLLVREALKRGIKVESIPGASALLTALTSSELPANTFTFLGYPPEKLARRTKLFEHLLQMNRLIYSTYIFYCAPHKLEQTLVDMKTVFGDIEIVIARELTKIHEEVWKGKISEALMDIEHFKGELVLLLNLSTKEEVQS